MPDYGSGESFMCFAMRGCRARRFCGIATFTVFVLSLVASASPKDHPKAHTTWSTYLGSPDASHYTALRQIDRSNVGRLQVAWSFDSGSEQPYAFNPIVDGRTMYVWRKIVRSLPSTPPQGKNDGPITPAVWVSDSRAIEASTSGRAATVPISAFSSASETTWKPSTRRTAS